MAINDTNGNNEHNESQNKPSGKGFSAITGSVQKDLATYLQKEHIDINSLSAEEKYITLNKFLETHYKNDAELLSDTVKRDDVAKENYFLDEILQDVSLSAYTDKTQGSIPFAQGLVTTAIHKVLAMQGLPAGLVSELEGLLATHTKSTLSIDVFRLQLQGILDTYDQTKNTSTAESITSEQQKQIADISISNNDILETLKTEELISEDQYNDIKTKNYAERSPEWKKIWATQLRKQFTHSYIDIAHKSQEAGAGMESLVAMPTIEKVFSAYAKKLGVPYDEMIDQSKPGINFSMRSKEEKQGIMDTLIEEYYLPNAQKFGAKLGLDVKQYESFIRQLFSLDTKELTIPGEGENAIKLKFLKKDINAYIPVEGMDQSRMDELIPLDFVLDASDEKEMQKLSMAMPGKQRHHINGVKHIDPQQELSLQINRQTVTGYGYKTMHDGEEKYVITKSYTPRGKQTNTMMVLTKDGTYKMLKSTQEEEVIMISTNKNAENDAYHIGQKEPLVHSLQSHDIGGLLTAYCLNNTTNLSDEDKQKLFVPVPLEPKLDEFFKDGMLGKNPENEERLKKKEQKEGETPEEFETRTAKELAEAKETWNKILGAKDVKFQKGTQLAIQNVDSIFKDIAGNGGYTMLEITEADDRENPTRFKYKVLGGMETDISDESGVSLTGEVSERLPFSKEFFDTLKDYGNGSLYKFPPKSAVGNLLDYPKMFDFANPGMNELAAKFAKLEADGNGLKRNGDDITHFGMDITTYNDDGEGSDTYVMFSTKFADGEVTVNDKDGKYNKTMSYTEFVLFVADKGLNPYTQKDYDELVGPADTRYAKSGTAVFMMSPMNIIEGVKKYRQGTVVEGAKKSNERRADKIEEMFYTSSITGHLGKLPFWGEYFVQAQDEYDGKLADKRHKIIMEGDATMNQPGKKLVRGKSTFVDNHNLKGAARQAALDYIAEKFEMAKNGTLTDVDRREAFAGLLYVLEKFQITYPRTLAKYAGEHLRPRLLLSEYKFKIYMKGFNEAKAKLEAGVAAGENVRELTENVMEYDVKNMSELMKDEYHRFLYGYKSIPVLQEHSGKRSTDVARKDGAEAAGHHPAFMRAYKEEIETKIKYGQYSYAIGALIQLSKRKEISVPQYYRLWMGAVLKIILSGGMKYVTNRTDKKRLRDMLRKHGIPVANFILDDSQGAENLAALLDVISQKANPNGKGFKEGTGWNTSLTAYETRSKPKNFADKKDFGSHQTFNKNFDKWFMGEGNAAKILPFLENSNLDKSVNMATLARDSSLNSKESKIVKDYLTRGINADPARDYDAYKSGEDFVQNLIQDHTVLNVSRQLVQDEYMNYKSNGTFGGNEETVGYFWEALENQFAGYAKKETLPSASVELLLTKYYTLFQNSYGGDHQWFVAMIAYMKNAKTKQERSRYARAAISNYIKKNNGYSVFPAVMASAFAEIENFFVNHIDSIDDPMIENLIQFDELESTRDQRSQAMKTYRMMNKKDITKKYPKQDAAIQKYISDLSSGKISGGSKGFTSFDAERGTSDYDADDEEGFVASQAESAQAELAEQELEESNKKDQLSREENEKEVRAMEEKKRKEAEEKERKDAEEKEEAEKKESQPA